MDFHEEYYWLDNMWVCDIWWNSILFNSVEQGFVYFKIKNDPPAREKILRTKDPYECKVLGRVPGVMREDWDDIKFGIMYELVKLKFQQNFYLSRMLLDTGDLLLVEGNTWCDNLWGDCVCKDCKDIPGQNWLGKILMSLRAQHYEQLYQF